MATYVVGDLQGCFDELNDLLELIAFDAKADRLVFAGDIVNRGPKSLECLRFAKSLGDAGVTVLGNHDLHLLAASVGARPPKSLDTLDAILDAPDRAELLAWLSSRPLGYWVSAHGVLVVHAGLPPQWSCDDALVHAAELEATLQSGRRDEFLRAMYGNRPDLWSENLQGQERLRFITNAFTRMRYVTPSGRLDMEYTGPPHTAPARLHPWFAHPRRASRGCRIVFGHWATLQNHTRLDPAHGVVHLDTGCVWGGRLSAIRLDDNTLFSVPSRQPKVQRH